MGTAPKGMSLNGRERFEDSALGEVLQNNIQTQATGGLETESH